MAAQHKESSIKLSFLATLVALHFTPVSESVSRWAEFRTIVAWSLRACFCKSCSWMCVCVLSVLVGVGMVTLTSPVTMPTFDTTNITSNHPFFARSISVAGLIKVVVTLDFIDRSTFTISGRQLKTDPKLQNTS